MDNFEFRLPDIGEGVTEGEVVSWLAQVGDEVAENQDLVEVMTDKATVTIGSPRAGKVAELRAKPGDVVPVGSVLVVLATDGSGAPTPAGGSEPAAASAEEAAEGPTKAPAPALALESEQTVASAVGDLKTALPGVSASAPGRGGELGTIPDRPLASPAVRKRARELGIDLRLVQATGSSGQVTRDDLERYHAEQVSARTARDQDPGAPPPRPAPRGGRDERIPIRGVRRRIFENMSRSKNTAAHFTYVDECDVTELKAVRQRARSLAEDANVSLNFLPFIVKATVAALKKHPALNSLVDDESMEIVRRAGFDIGIAVATDAGLIVPVVRNAEQLSVLEIAREIDRMAVAARSGRVDKEDLGGSSFTITSLGRQGGLFATPVINYPEVAILGVHEIKRRPVVKGDQIVVGDVMLLSLSFDHRVIDGHVGAAFARDLIRYLEQPDRLLIDG
jgi:pyruvate dehydrogenase E2 component (dihydrolipoamide acetyltransferase)